MYDLPKNFVESRDLILWEPSSSKMDWEGCLFLYDVWSQEASSFLGGCLWARVNRDISQIFITHVMSPHLNQLFTCTFSQIYCEVCFFISELLKTDIVESRWITLVFWVSFSSVRFKKKKILPFFNQCYFSVKCGREVHYFASLPVWSHFYKPVKMFSISQP